MFRKSQIIRLVILLFVIVSISFADEKQDKEEYVFNDLIEIPHTSIKDQGWTGTCWDFATISFLESEAIRKNDLDSIDLSEMYPVRWAYVDKAQNYVRRHGNATFGQGGQAHDVLDQMQGHGLVPQQIFQSYKIDKELNHREVADVLKGFLDGVLAGEPISERWLKAYNAILDVYLGQEVKSFEYNGENYSPQEFMKNYLNLDPDDYIEIISFSDKFYYKQTRLEVPDNWNYNDQYYNVKLKDIRAIVDYSLKNGYSVCWDADVSDEYFDYKDSCVAFVPAEEPEDDEEEIALPPKEKEITPEMRQAAYNTFQTTDDHLMHIIGLAHDQHGNQFYKVKNSWGKDGKYEGYYYISVPYFKLRTINIMVNKEALPKEIRKKLGFKTGLF